ncbi:MAG: triose-phosphate isomerase [Clostridia bacterium]
MKNKILAGNWKMNNDISCARQLLTQLIPLVKESTNTVVACVPYTDLAVAVELCRGTNIKIGAQNVHWASSGAFTGEISAPMLQELGVAYVIIGHSERRTYFGETDATICMRIKKALEYNLLVIMCIGESLAQRQSNQTQQILNSQLSLGLKDISSSQAKNIIVAYEPIWAIGTGVTATTQQAQETICYIRKTLSTMFGENTAKEMYIQYGGSMNQTNAQELLSQPDIDGGLIGGASLDATKFATIANYNK